MRCEKEDVLSGTITELGTCQVRSGTDHPCPCQAVARIRGVPFCERCSREQEAYFAVGDLSQALSADYQTGQDREDLHGEPLVEALDRVRWELAGRIVEAGRHLMVKRET